MNLEDQKALILEKENDLSQDQIEEIKNAINLVISEKLGAAYELDQVKISVKDADDKDEDSPFNPMCKICYYPNGQPYLYCGGGVCP